MIIVRDVFHLQFGKARQATDLLRRGQAALREGGYPVDRLLTDVTGEYYTLVMESRFENLGAFETAMAQSVPSEEWQELYGQLVPLVRHGKREVFREVT